jgi:hypothetical protein
MEINDQLEAPANLNPDTTEYDSVRSSEEKSPSLLPGFKPRIVKPVA